jgi:hypothetical protein
MGPLWPWQCAEKPKETPTVRGGVWRIPIHLTVEGPGCPALVVDMPVCASDSVMLIEDVSSEAFQVLSDLMAIGGVPDWDTDVASLVRKMIANYGAVTSSAIDDFHESSHGFGFRRRSMCCHPMVHLADMRCRSVSTEKLASVFPPPLRHKLSLSFYRAAAARDPDGGKWEFSLGVCNKSIYVKRAHLRRVRMSDRRRMVSVPVVFGGWEDRLRRDIALFSCEPQRGAGRLRSSTQEGSGPHGPRRGRLCQAQRSVVDVDGIVVRALRTRFPNSSHGVPKTSVVGPRLR